MTRCPYCNQAECASPVLHGVMAERDEAVNQFVEAGATLDWISDALGGKPVSDFGESMPLVRLAMDLRAERDEAMARVDVLTRALGIEREEGAKARGRLGSMSDEKRCQTCDKPLATKADYEMHQDGCRCEYCASLCWAEWNHVDCRGDGKDWRTDALALREQLATLRAAQGESDVRLAGVVAERDHCRLALAQAMVIVAAGKRLHAARLDTSGSMVAHDEVLDSVNEVCAAVAAHDAAPAAQEEKCDCGHDDRVRDGRIGECHCDGAGHRPPTAERAACPRWRKP